MAQALSGSPVARRTVFILADGSFVVQWDEHRVQDLLTGHYRRYEDKDFGHIITEYELNQLKAAGRVEHYNDQYIWLNALPEHGRFPHDREYHSPARVRSYYLNTTLPEDQLNSVEARLRDLNLDSDFLARVRGSLIAVLGRNGAPFRQLKDAERAQKLLMVRAPDFFEHTAIAFVETNDNPYSRTSEPGLETFDLDTVISSQSDTTITSGKRVLVISSNDEEQQAMHHLLGEMKIDVIAASTAAQGLQLLEDYNPDMLLMDMKLPDMHGWELLAKIKEIGTYEEMPKILVADHQSTPDDQAFALTVGKVDVYLAKPISMAQLRQNVWLTFKHRQDTTDKLS